MVAARRRPQVAGSQEEAQPNQRFDLVVNDLTALAYLTSKISMTSDGSPWRPLVHILDIAKATRCVLDADEDACTARCSTWDPTRTTSRYARWQNS